MKSDVKQPGGNLPRVRLHLKPAMSPPRAPTTAAARSTILGYFTSTVAVMSGWMPQ